MLTKISFYGYLFADAVEDIIRYDILWRSGNKYLIKSTLLNLDYENSHQDVTVNVHGSLSRCIAGIVLKFRNLEVATNLYEGLQTTESLPAVYSPWISDLEKLILEKQILSFSLFGNGKKYVSQRAVKTIIRDMGYFVLCTRPPHLYVLDDFIQQEQQRSIQNDTTNKQKRDEQ
jgi:hypothetical protein